MTPGPFTTRRRTIHLGAVVATLVAGTAFALAAPPPGNTKTETFDKDPGWEGVNNRSASTAPKATVKQDFGYSDTQKAGGKKAGEIGGHISPAGEVAYYGMVIDPKTFEDKLTASGTLSNADGEHHLLLGFFNADTVNEWRTPNTISMRINGRGDFFYAYAEQCTSKWRASGDNTPFPSTIDPTTGRKSLIGFPSKGKPHQWSITYDPAGEGGKGAVTCTLDGQTATAILEEGHRKDGATFNRFGIMNIMKSADKGTEIFIDDLTVNGQPQSFDADPKWEGKNNRNTYQSKIVRPRFDFGFSDTHFAGGKGKGELGGMMFRGDCRYPERMACYGDKIGPLTLDKPIMASGKIAMTRGVTDSTTLFGFYNAADSMKKTDSQSNGVPESVLGVHLEGPSSEGFLFYPVYHAKGAGNALPPTREFSFIYPDRKSRDWSMKYDPDGAGGNGQITVTFDGTTKTFDLKPGDKSRGTTFDRFGIVTSWIDGNSQDVYWDDVTYTAGQ